MVDLLFVEVGTVVTEILAPTRCTIEPFCDPASPPTYRVEARVEVDLALSLESVLSDRGPQESVAVAAQRALCDRIDSAGTAIGPSWPGGTYEGIVSFREGVLRANESLAAAAASLPGCPWEYQVVACIDEETGDVRRYHGFYAEVVRDDGGVLVLQVASAGMSTNPSWREAAQEVRYDPDDTATFYTGALVEDSVIKSGAAPGTSGSVFITPEGAASSSLLLPKLPAGAGL